MKEIEEKETDKTNGTPEIRMLLRKDIRRDENQPRKVFDEKKLQELADSIVAVGIRQPIQVEWVTGLELKAPDSLSKNWSVFEGGKCLFNSKEEAAAKAFIAGRPNGFYRIVDGERRWRAAEVAKVERVTCMIVDTTSPDWAKQKLAIQVVLNQQHENLTALEEAAAYKKEIEEGRHTAESLYKALGVSRAHLFGRLRLNNLKGKGLEALKSGTINASVAGLVAMVPESQHEDLLENMVNYNGEPKSFREVQALIEREYVRQLKDAPFDTKDAELLPIRKRLSGERSLGGACTDCPFRSGNMDGGELKNPNVCTKPECFDLKVDARAKSLVANAKKEGKQVLEGKAAEKLFSKHADYEGNYDVLGASGFIDLSRRCEPLGWDYKNNWRAALKKAFDNPELKPAVTLAVDPEGELRELVEEKQATALLWEECGHKKQSNSNGGNDAFRKEQAHRRKQEQERKEENAAAMAVMVAKAEATAEKQLKAKEFWKVLARATYSRAGFYLTDPIRKRRGWDKDDYSGKVMAAELEKMTVAQIVGLVVETAVGCDEDDENDMAKLLGADTKGAVKKVKEERAARVKAKGKVMKEAKGKWEKAKAKGAKK